MQNYNQQKKQKIKGKELKKKNIDWTYFAQQPITVAWFYKMHISLYS